MAAAAIPIPTFKQHPTVVRALAQRIPNPARTTLPAKAKQPTQTPNTLGADCSTLLGFL